MFSENTLPNDFYTNLVPHSNQEQKSTSEEPFMIIYNHRSSKYSKSRKGSMTKKLDEPFKFKKPRKMTLPVENSMQRKFS